MIRLRAWIAGNILDITVAAGVILVAYGLGLYSSPLLPIVLGLGLIATVRFGSR